MPDLSDLIAQTNRRTEGDGGDADQTRPIRITESDANRARRLSDEERRAILRRYREHPPEHEPDFDDGARGGRSWGGDGGHAAYPDYAVAETAETRTGRDKLSGRTVTLGAILVIGILAVSLGAGGVFGGRGASAPEPTATPPPVVVALGSPAVVEETVASGGGASSPAASSVEDPIWPGQGDGRAVVCLDPGHGGWDPGFMRPLGGALPGLAEADYNLAQAYDLAERLGDDGFEVIMTRRSPSAVNADGADINGDGETLADSEAAGTVDELQARIDICNEAGADLLVSMHINGFDIRPWVKGYETWYTGSRPFGDQSQRFATLVYRALGTEMENRGYITDGREVNDDRQISVDASDSSLFDHMIVTGPDVRGQIQASQMPGAIVEALFISNDDDAYFLDSPEGHDAIVSAYESAIVDYFDEIQA